MAQYGWLLDAKRCIECRACEAACKQWNQVETGIDVRYRRVRVKETGKFPAVQTVALSLACNHCENPWCEKVCPTKAMRRREDGLVLIDSQKCIGCRMCEQFCPYQVPNFNTRTGKMEKCTMCVDRLSESLRPACATLCPTDALQWGDWEKIGSAGEDRVPGFTDPEHTRPRIRFVVEGWSRK